MICSKSRPLLHRSEDLIFAVRLRGVMEGIDLAQGEDARAASSCDPHRDIRERVGELPPGVAYMPKPWQPLEVLSATEQALASRV